MKACPNCGKNVKENYMYCSRCGCEIDGANPGDYSTGIRNLFRNDEGYYYLFAVRGVQEILRADTVEEAKALVQRRSFPWIGANAKSADKSHEGDLNKVIRSVESGNSVKVTLQKRFPDKKPKPAGISRMARKRKVSENPFVGVSKDSIGTSLQRIISQKTPHSLGLSKTGRKRKAPKKADPIPYEDLPREYGVVGVYRKYRNGRYQWAFKTNETKAAIYNDRLAFLKKDVQSKKLKWDVVNEALEQKSLKGDFESLSRRDEQILAKRRKNSGSVADKKKKISKISGNWDYSLPNDTALDRMFR